MAGFTGNGRAHLELIDADFIDHFDFTLFEQGTVFNQHVAIFVFDILLQHTTEHTFAEIDDNIATLDDRT